MDNFDDAKQATEDMFDGQEVLGEENTPQDTPQEPQQEGQAQEPQQAGQEQEPQAQEQPTQDNNAVDEAANVAQAAAQAAAQREQDYQRIMEENEQLRQTNNELQQTITQQSQQREQAIIEERNANADVGCKPFSVRGRCNCSENATGLCKCNAKIRHTASAKRR